MSVPPRPQPLALPLGELSPQVTERDLRLFAGAAIVSLSVLAALGHLSHRERQEVRSLSEGHAELASANKPRRAAGTGVKKVRSVFCGGMRVGKNTHRSANVRLCAEGVPVRCGGLRPFK